MSRSTKSYPPLEDDVTLTRSEYYAEATHDHSASCTCLACCLADESKLMRRRECHWCHEIVMSCTCPEGSTREETV